MSDPAARTRHTLVALGLVQGLALLLMHLLLARHVLRIPGDMVWVLPGYATALGVPTALQLAVTAPRDRRLWLFGLGLAAALVLTGAYAGYAVAPDPAISTFPVVVPYLLTAVIGWYVALPFAQAWLKTGRLRPAYADLFGFAWDNVITLLIAGVFTGIFWALLGLWAALFKVIGIGFFGRLFYDKYFVYPVTATVFALALYLGRSHAAAVVTVRRIVLAIFKGLLPLLAVIITLFLAALPFMGLKPLWGTGNATTLMLTLQIFLVVFLNAVFQNARGEAPYPGWLRTAVRVAVVLLPIYTALCFYALYLRIGQHGWSTDRFWAVLLAFVTGLYVLGYALAALRRRDPWMGAMAPVNIAVAAIVVVLSLAVNSPLLDARRIAVASQLARLLDGRIAAAKFDYGYLRFQLGRTGNAALARLGQIVGPPQAAVIRAGAQQALARTNTWSIPQDNVVTPAQAAAHFSVFPRGEHLDDSFLQYAMRPRGRLQLKGCLELNQHCAVLVARLNRDDREDYIVFRVNGRWDQSIDVLAQTGRDWTRAGNLNAGPSGRFDDIEQVEALLAKGDYATVASPWKDLRVGDQTHHFGIDSY